MTIVKGYRDISMIAFNIERVPPPPPFFKLRKTVFIYLVNYIYLKIYINVRKI